MTCQTVRECHALRDFGRGLKSKIRLVAAQQAWEVPAMRFLIGTSTAFHLRHLAVELLSRGHEVEFHSYLPRWKTRQYGLPDRAVVSHFLPLLPWSGLALLRGWSRQLTPLRHKLFARIDARIAARVARQDQSIDVFVGLSSVAVASAAAARDSGALVLIECGISHIRNRDSGQDAYGGVKVDPLYVERELASYAAADCIVLLSRFARSSFIDHGVPDSRLAVVSLGADLDRFVRAAVCPGLPVKALVVGNWSFQKGCDLVEPLLQQVPDLTVDHIGAVVDAPLPRSGRFRSLGHMPQAALARAMQDYHLLLFPSRDDGFGMVMAEALAVGLRVVASDTSGGPDLADLIGPDFVSVFPSGAADDLVQAVSAQIKAITESPSSAAAPMDRIAQLSWSGYGDRYLAMVDRLLRNR